MVANPFVLLEILSNKQSVCKHIHHFLKNINLKKCLKTEFRAHRTELRRYRGVFNPNKVLKLNYNKKHTV